MPALTRVLITLCVSAAAILAWQSYGDAARRIIVSSYAQLGWLAPRTAPVAYSAPDQQRFDAISVDLDAIRQIVDRIAVIQEQITRNVDQHTAGQEQMMREINKQQAAEQQWWQEFRVSVAAAPVFAAPKTSVVGADIDGAVRSIRRERASVAGQSSLPLESNWPQRDRSGARAKCVDQ
jgi:hypothetical protein